MDNNKDGPVYQGPQGQAQQPPTVAPIRARKSMAPFVGLAVLVFVLAVATGYFLFIRNFKAKEVGEASAWMEYTDESGFSFSYPSNFNLSKTENGLILSEEGELRFEVRDMEGKALREVLDKGGDPETFAVGSRTGYRLADQNITYYYFPLFGGSYLQISDKVNGGEGKEIISKLNFVAPQSASVN